MCQTCNDTGVVVTSDGMIAAFQKCPDCVRTLENERRLSWLRQQVAEYKRRKDGANGMRRSG